MPHSNTSSWHQNLTQPGISGLTLLSAALLGPVIASSPCKALYHHLLSFRPLTFFPLTISHWISEGLMSFFFLSIALEIRHALSHGPLNHWKQASLPLIGALGGIAVPACIAGACGYFLPASSGAQGWAIPTATDAAFTVPIVAMLPFLPNNLRIFLMALAIFDDLGAILVLALFYGHSPNFACLSLALLPLIAMIGLAWRNVTQVWIYSIPALSLWFVLFYAGIEPTLAGIALGLCLPPIKGVMINRILKLPLNLIILPLFAFISTDIDIRLFTVSFLTAAPFLGSALGLFLGKPIGVFSSVWLANKTGFLPDMPNVHGIFLFGTGILCGIGFTISLLITQLAYSDTLSLTQGRCGVFIGSALSAFFGWAILKRSSEKREQPLSQKSMPIPYKS